MFKRLLFLVVATLSFYGVGLGQANNIDSIRFEGSLSTISPLYKTCKVGDSTALILALNQTSRWTEGKYSDYVVFYPNGEIKIIQAFLPNAASKKEKWKKTKIGKGDASKFWDLLDSCIANDLLNLDQEKLNNDKKRTEDGRTAVLGGADGPFYSFAIFKGRNYLNNSAYSPQSFISAEYPGLEERQKFLAVVQGFQKLITRSVKKRL